MTLKSLRSTCIAGAVYLLTFAPTARSAAALETAASVDTSAATDTLRHVVPLPEVVVSTTRTGTRSPFARSQLGRDDLRRANTGEDTPMILAHLPGAYAYSDAGNGIGYSYLSIRGFPQRRISVLINGVPLNDPESHEVYWIDHPDLLASTSEVELQRGVGSALYGAASLGGSVNLETGPMDETPHTSALTSVGTFDTRRLMLEMGSGRLPSGWNLYARYSRIESAGYRDQSDTRLWSYALSALRVMGRQSLRVNLYGGPEETHLAYLAIPAEYLTGGMTGNSDRDRRFNPLTYPGERDHFFEPHYELIHSWSPAERVLFSQTLFYFDGRGYYDEQRLGQALGDYRLPTWATADSTLAPRDYYEQDGTGALATNGAGQYLMIRSDVVRRREIVDRHFGWVPRVRLEHAGGALTVGGELRAHDGHHTGQVLSGGTLPPGTAPDVTYYDYHPRTLAAGFFVREEHALPRALRATLDLAWRHEAYTMERDAFDGVKFDQSYDFALPRVALDWAPREAVNAFASWSYSSREPAFRDLYDGEGPGNVPLFANANVATNTYGAALIRPEHVYDFELGGSWRGAAASATINLFRMNFSDELVYAGQFNTDLGYPILGNAARSVHEGVELAARAERRAAGGLIAAFDGNATLSDNHFIRYREVYGLTAADTFRYDGNKIALFPAMLAHLALTVRRSGAALGAQVHYAGRQYLDNTESVAASIGPVTTLDLNASWRGALPGAGGQSAGPPARDRAGVQAGGGPGADGSAVGPRAPTIELLIRIANALDRRYVTSGYMDYDAAGNLVPMFVPAATRAVTGQVRIDF